VEAVARLLRNGNAKKWKRGDSSSYKIDLIRSILSVVHQRVTGAEVECDRSPSFCGFPFYCTRFAGWYV
jgi:hypothetical protein